VVPDEGLSQPAACSAEVTVDDAGATVVVLAGEFDISNVEVLHRALGGLADGSKPVVAMSEVRFMDSSGIAALIQGATRLGALRIRSAPAIVRRIIETMDLEELLPLEGE
jgi:anti-anti-sigma factor